MVPEAQAQKDEPLDIDGIDVESVGVPTNDGTRGSGLYEVPIKLNRRPTAEESTLLASTWDHPPSFTTMHRPGILTVTQNAIVLTRTTIEEVQRYHATTLRQVVDRVNAVTAERRAARSEAESARLAAVEEHRQNVADVASRIDFSSVSSIGGSANRNAYRLDRVPIGDGGQAQVFRAEIKATGEFVAFKRLKSSTKDSRARMKREIELGKLVTHPNVMPVLDHDENFEWFVMPLAEERLEDRRLDVRETDELRSFLKQLCEGLTKIHELGWTHRDIKPSNILKVKGRWVVADCGLARRPRGETTADQRTRVGMALGTEGFAAPELSIDAHDVDETVDVYGLGQLVGWIRTGRMPLQNMPLLPDTDDAWRGVVRAAAHTEPSRRPATVEKFIDLIAATFDSSSTPASRAQLLADELQAGSTDRLLTLLKLGVSHPQDGALIIDVISGLPLPYASLAAERHPSETSDVVEAIRDYLINGNWGQRNFDQANEPLRWMLAVAKRAAELGLQDLFEVAFSAVIEADEQWHRFQAQDDIASWLQQASGWSARMAATALHRFPTEASRYKRVITGDSINADIASAIRTALE